MHSTSHEAFCGPDPARKIKPYRPGDLALREVEAESVAYVTAKRSGLSPRSDSYLNTYKGALDDLDVHRVLAVDHAGVARELGPALELPGPGLARFGFPTAAALHGAVSRAYDLAKALPDDPLLHFRDKTRSLPQTTEAERLIVSRVGQDIFRDALMRFWQGRCPITGITDPALLRASHMKPWAECGSDVERLDVYNGLLLSALWDAAFDKYLVTFREDGFPEFSSRLSAQARARLDVEVGATIRLSDAHLPYLSHHRAVFARLSIDETDATARRFP